MSESAAGTRPEPPDHGKSDQVRVSRPDIARTANRFVTHARAHGTFPASARMPWNYEARAAAELALRQRPREATTAAASGAAAERRAVAAHAPGVQRRRSVSPETAKAWRQVAVLVAIIAAVSWLMSLGDPRPGPDIGDEPCSVGQPWTC